MGSIDRIAKLTGQYEKEMELAERYRTKAKEQTELADKHTRKAEDLEKQIKYEKGGEVFDRVNALDLSPEELQLILKLLDDKTQLMDAVQKLFPERLRGDRDNNEDFTAAGEGENEEFPYTEETPDFGDFEEDDSEEGEENW